MTQSIGIQPGSGNIFTDLELENSDELLIKAELARKIGGIVTNQNMTQAEAAELLASVGWVERSGTQRQISAMLGSTSASPNLQQTAILEFILNNE
jgi:hypothetical protein